MATPRPPSTNGRHPWVAAVLSAIVPGAGQLYARRYLRSVMWFAPLLLVALASVPVLSMRTTDLVGAALSPQVLWTFLGANVIAAIWRIAASADAFYVAKGTESESGNGFALAVGLSVIAVVVLAPHVVVGRYTVDAVTFVEAVFVTEVDTTNQPQLIPIGTDADIVPDPVVHLYDVDPSDPQSTRNLVFRNGFGDPDAVAAWEGIVLDQSGSMAATPFEDFTDRVGAERITILFAGGDAGPGRGGLRTDSMMVATIDPTTGKAALFGFPRNMAQIPLPKKFGSAFIDLQRKLAPQPEPVENADEDAEGEEAKPVAASPAFSDCRCFPEQLNALYPYTRKWTGTYPNEVDPGMAALRDVLSNLMGIPIDYYALIDMAAFVDLVDAIGGVDVFVLKPLESEVSPPREGEPWAKVKVDVGWNHLDGPQALAYARARKGSSDYTRMARQRCMVKAVAASADPVTLLRSFPRIVDAVEGSVVTNVPLTFVADLISAAAGLDFDDIETVGVTHSYWEPERDHRGKPIPDLDRIRSKVRRVLAGQADPEAEFEVSPECEV